MYYKITENGYISMFGEGKGGIDISKAEYESLKSVMSKRPSAQKGYDYRLKEDLTWELYELPVEEIEAEATEADYQNALREMGVEV